MEKSSLSKRKTGTKEKMLLLRSSSFLLLGKLLYGFDASHRKCHRTSSKHERTRGDVFTFPTQLWGFDILHITLPVYASYSRGDLRLLSLPGDLNSLLS